MLQYSETDDTLTVRFHDEKIRDEEQIQEIGMELMESCEYATSNNKGKIILDFDSVQFMSSAMIGKLILFNKRSKEDGLHVRLDNVCLNVMEVFRITRLDKVFRFDKDDDHSET